MPIPLQCDVSEIRSHAYISCNISLLPIPRTAIIKSMVHLKLTKILEWRTIYLVLRYAHEMSPGLSWMMLPSEGSMGGETIWLKFKRNADIRNRFIKDSDNVVVWHYWKINRLNIFKGIKDKIENFGRKPKTLKSSQRRNLELKKL